MILGARLEGVLRLIKPKDFKLGRGGTGNNVLDALACRLAKAYSLSVTPLRPGRIAVGIGSDLERGADGKVTASGLSRAVAIETAKLYYLGLVERVGFTGGLQIGGVSERSSMADIAEKEGVPPRHIIIDENLRQHCTYEQASSVPALVRKAFPGITARGERDNVIVVDTSLHARRTKNFFDPVFSAQGVDFQMDPVFEYDHPTGKDSLQILFRFGLIGYIPYEFGWNLPPFRALQKNEWFIEKTRSGHSDRDPVTGRIR